MVSTPILAKTSIAKNFDFAIIDIDGNDYHVWNAIVNYRPKMVMIEFNPTIPPAVNYVQPRDPSINRGSSLAAFVDLGKKKGYELISVFGVNAFFVGKEFYSAFGITDNSVHALWTNRDSVTYFFSGYDGRIILRGCCKMPWHDDLPIRESALQVLPRFARGYPFKLKNRFLYCLLRPFHSGHVVKASLKMFRERFSGASAEQK